MPNVSKHFDTSSDYAAWVRERKHGYTGGHFSGMSGDETWRGLEQLERGDESNVEKAKALLNELQESIELIHYQWEHELAGAFPDVPAYLAGEPLNMWTRQEITTDRSPLRVWVGLTSSAGITHEQLTKRGVTLAAFALAMSDKRPVYITPYVNLGSFADRYTYGSYRRRGRRYNKYESSNQDGSKNNALISWDISTSPLILSELMACLSSPLITRHVGIVACRMLNDRTDGAWHSDFENEPAMREHLGAKPDDLYLPSIYLYDPLLQNPLQWLKDNIKRYSDSENEEEE